MLWSLRGALGNLPGLRSAWELSRPLLSADDGMEEDSAGALPQFSYSASGTAWGLLGRGSGPAAGSHVLPDDASRGLGGSLALGGSLI